MKSTQISSIESSSANDPKPIVCTAGPNQTKKNTQQKHGCHLFIKTKVCTTPQKKGLNMKQILN